MNTGFRVLLVEDNQGDVELVKRALRDRDRPVSLTIASDGVEGLGALHRMAAGGDGGMPDIVLLDLNMPRMDGKMLLETVKTDARLKTVPIVMLTSSQSPADIQDCYDRHASYYVVKPFNGGEFVSVVRQIVSHWSEVVQLP